MRMFRIGEYVRRQAEEPFALLGGGVVDLVEGAFNTKADTALMRGIDGAPTSGAIPASARLRVPVLHAGFASRPTESPLNNILTVRAADGILTRELTAAVDISEDVLVPANAGFDVGDSKREVMKSRTRNGRGHGRAPLLWDERELPLRCGGAGRQ